MKTDSDFVIFFKGVLVELKKKWYILALILIFVVAWIFSPGVPLQLPLVLFGIWIVLAIMAQAKKDE